MSSRELHRRSMHLLQSKSHAERPLTPEQRRLLGQVYCELLLVTPIFSPMGIVDELLANPGLYVGTDRVLNTERVGAARIVITPLPGRAGVTLDYEIFNPTIPERLHGHVEHTMIGRAHEGPSFMVISDLHASSLAILQETQPGVFELGGQPAAYPMKVVILIPEPGRLHHEWWFGAPGEEAIKRVVADLTQTT